MGFSKVKSADSKVDIDNADCTRINTTGSVSRFLRPLCVAACLANSSIVYALGVGGVETKSFIGQPLWVEVPLYNVEAPNTLQITLERLNGDEANGLTAVLSRANSQLSVLIRSDGVVNEPYFNFALNLIDQGNAFRKQFTVLLDLSPNDVRNRAGANPISAPVTTSRVDESESTITPVVSEVAPAVSSVMGPYDWAKAGAIPEKFGAVLDGQSLWRVARRISPAMNVSNNQMMWALYQANPHAFSSSSIESLRAGTFLTIPAATEVASVSDVQAKRLLAELSNANQSTATTDSVLTSTTPLAAEPEADLIIQEANSDQDDTNAVTESQFQLSGLDASVSEGGNLVASNDEQSKEIINSLAATISSMTEQLSRKDQQIEVLETQVSELKQFIEQGDSGVATALAQPERVETPVPTDGVSTSVTQSSVSKYGWLLAVLAALLLLGVAMRSRLAQLWSSLNFGGANDQVEFSPTIMDEPRSQRVIPEPTVQPVTAEINRASSEPVAFSEDSHSESSFSDLEFSEEFTEAEIFVDEGVPEDELDFEERFARLVSEGDLEFARQLLDIAHGQDVDNERYHFYRLKLLAMRFDEDAFYDYYYSIESDIPNFTNVVQTDISKLVVQLAQN